MLSMGTFGGRRAVACAAVLLALSASLLTGCSTSLDQAHRVQTRLGRIDEVVDSTVTTPTTDRAPAIAVTYRDAPTQRQLSQLLAGIERVADDASYPAFRLDLTPVDAPGDRLVVDDSFIGSDHEAPVLDNWLRAPQALLGDVVYSYQPGNETITVESGPAIAHDVGEVSRLRYGFRDTTWVFTNLGTSFRVTGRVSPTDVQLFSAVQRSVSSTGLRAPAPTWRLDRLTDHVLLDLDVDLPGAAVTPDRITIARYGDDVTRLVIAALDATEVASQPLWLRLHHRASGTDDIFGYWIQGQRPVRGRDRLARGWDQLIDTLARDRR